MIDIMGVIFGLLDFSKAMIFLKAWNFVPAILLFGAYAVLSWTSKDLLLFYYNI